MGTQGSTTSERLSHAVGTAVDLAPDEASADNLRAHCLWEVDQVLSHLELEDFETSELLALLAVICPVHSRVLPGTWVSTPEDITYRGLRAVT